jgi:cytosine deaminase
MGILFKNACPAGEAESRDFLLDQEIIQKTGRNLSAPPGNEVYELAGRTISPAFADIHTHMDKAYNSGLIRNVSGTLGEAIGNFAGMVNSFSEEDFYRRGKMMLDQALVNGVLYLRSHITISASIGLRAIEAVARLKKDYGGLLDLEIIAFPGDKPEGMGKEVRELTLRSFGIGAGIVGGTPNRYHDERRFIDDLFEIAKETGRDLDLHIDEKDEPVALSLEYLADKTIQEGYQGRVTAGHCCSLSAVPHTDAERIIGKVKEAGITIVTLPSCNLYLIGRQDRGLIRRGPTRVQEFLDAGVNVALSSDNIRDPFRPFGNADILEETLLAAQVFRMDTPSRLMEGYRMATSNPAKTLKIKGYGLKEGDRANLVVLDAPSVPEAILGQSDKMYVVSRGKIIVKTTREVVKFW